jgi:hypothetical protein
MTGDVDHRGPAESNAMPAPSNSVSDMRWNFGFGIALATFALIALVVWFPRDITGGFIETNEVGKVGPGDAFFPVLLAVSILLLSVIDLLVNAIRMARDFPMTGGVGRLTVGNLVFLARFHVAVLVGLIVMYSLGPVVVAVRNALSSDVLHYRQLVDAVPYKYIGFIAGGFIVTLPTIAWAERRWSPRSALIVLAVLVTMIFVFDILLTNVQLPPNADY